MVLCKLSNPSRLSVVELLGLMEVLEVLIICPDFNVYGSAHEVVLHSSRVSMMARSSLL